MTPTPEERADACLEVPTRPNRGYDWSRADSVVMPTDLKDRIVAAIREAETAARREERREEREACAALAEETAVVGAMGVVLCRGGQIAAAIRARAP